MKNLKYFFLTISLCGSIFLINSCHKDNILTIKPEPLPPDLATKWADMTLKVMYRLPNNSPTYASRALGYIGLTMYESVVPSNPSTHTSIAKHLNQFGDFPVVESGKTYNWEVALNAGQAIIVKRMFDFCSDEMKDSIDAFAADIEQNIRLKTDIDVVERSKKFGEDVANAIYNWSLTDGGDKAYTRNFPTSYIMPTGAGKWQPPTKSQSRSKRPLHPYWGSNRLFVSTNNLPIPNIIPYSTDTTSQYYALFSEIYAKSFNLTQEERELAAWWSDDPTETYSPPGHSYNLATIAIRISKPNLIVATEAYARVGIATTDAFINCFKCKYTYYSERPSTYVVANIDSLWGQYWPEPPFPAFSSGHATQGAATAIVLSDIFGESFSFTDDTHKNRERDIAQHVDFRPRFFNSFWESAEEAAYSRFLGGIHTRQDNNQGLAQGRAIGYNVNKLPWRK